MPLSGKPLNRNFWENISEKIQKTLSCWKYSMLSKGGKITLINSLLTSLPTYQMSVFKAPPSIYRNIEQTWRNFFWKHPNDNNKLHLIKCSVITSPKEKGGLEISRIKDTNFPLLNKWLWRFIHEDKSLWKSIILAKYDFQYARDLPKYSSARAPWHSISKCIDCSVLKSLRTL